MKKKTEQIGIFGGSFNPPHLGHLLASLYALRMFPLDEVWFVPAFQHAFGKNLVSFQDRKKMCELLIQDLSLKLKVSSIEKEIQSDGKMLLTLQALKKMHPSKAFHLILGSDLLLETPRWFRFSSLKKEFPIQIIPRGKQTSLGFGIPNISSHQIRKRLRQNKPLDNLLTPEICSYIKKHHLYT